MVFIKDLKEEAWNRSRKIGVRKHINKKRKQTSSELPEGFDWGDHIKLIQIYELWDQTNYCIDWVKDNNLQVHPSSVLRMNDEGVFPNYVIYHELISTSHTYMRNVYEVEMEWVTPILKKLKKLNVKILSDGSNEPEEKTTDNSDVPKKDDPLMTPKVESKFLVSASLPRRRLEEQMKQHNKKREATASEAKGPKDNDDESYEVNLDENFLAALGYRMPPALGMV
nr:probable pre-mRNA-splicing factor ATP-dependent RNA helicase DEAH4 isoform X2 [Tanacetum cinerariifolium]